jgi:hypothetical protein
MVPELLRMIPKTYARLQGQMDRIVGCLSWDRGSDIYERAFAPAREMLRDQDTAPVKYIESLARKICPSYAHEFISAENLLRIDSEEKFRFLLSGISEEHAPEIERFFKQLLKLLQGLRSGLLLFAKLLPCAGVGRPSKMPTAEECREICAAISKLHEKDVPVVVAQGQVQRSELNKRRVKLRMIQMIWAQRDSWEASDRER